MGIALTVDPARCRDQALRSLSKLPPFSPILTKLMATLADEDVSFAHVGDLIEKDTVLAGNVLRLVNSAMYARRGTVNSVRHAVSILGLSKLRNATMSMSLARMWNAQTWPSGWIPSKFNLHGVAGALLADLIATELTTDYPEGAFAAGLLQNVGMLLIATGLPTEFIRIRDQYVSGSETLVGVERSLIGLDHAALSEEVLRQWNLPKQIQQAVGAHHEPPPQSLASVVQAADTLAEQHGILAQAWCRQPEGRPMETLERLGLGGKGERILQSFETEFETLRSFF